MKNIQILDTTLRDGGRVLNCSFNDWKIKDICNRLSVCGIDIVEIGFLRDARTVDYQGDSTFFTSLQQMIPMIKRVNSNTIYTAFVDYGMCDIDSLTPYDGKSVDAIRFGFTKKNIEENKSDVIRWANIIKEKGYKLFVQGVNTLNYTDLELLKLVELVNEIHPYSFGLVDTYGAMYIDDVDRLYNLIDHNLLSDVCINFHSHNNYQLSFAFAQEIIKLSGSGNRQVIIDSTLGGMGKVAGNLNTELIVDYLVRKKNYDYDFEGILDIIDDYISKYAEEYKWGYSTAAMLARIYKSHPNNIIYLTSKFRLDTKDIGHILALIDPVSRQRYDYNRIEQLYTKYAAEKVNDKEIIDTLRSVISEKEVLVLVPGNTLNTHKEIISQYINQNMPIIISVNFVSAEPNSYAFFGNAKRYARLKEKRAGKNVIVTSNIRSDCNESVVNYYSLIYSKYKNFEDSTIMLLNLLKRLNPRQITMAGFDGFSENCRSNFMDETFQNDRRREEYDLLNKEISNMFNEIVESTSGKCKYSIITPTFYHLHI